MLIGGVAVGYYGYPRTTGDIDFWVEDTQENAMAVAKVLEEFGLSLPDNFHEVFLQGNKVFRFGRQPLRIEVLTGISGVKFSDCYPRRRKETVEDCCLDIISLEDLKTNKQAAGRTNDVDDIAHLP